jgi:hypothetical protein
MSATYEVRAMRWARGWELHILGVGVTQSRSLTDAEAMVRDYIALDRDVLPESFDVTIMPEVGDGIDQEVADARRQVAEAADAQRRAAERVRALARRLKAKGLSGRDMAIVLGVTPQRVSQLTGQPRHPRKAAITATKPPSAIHRGRDPLGVTVVLPGAQSGS